MVKHLIPNKERKASIIRKNIRIMKEPTPQRATSTGI